jgi:hypothetical protein
LVFISKILANISVSPSPGGGKFAAASRSGSAALRHIAAANGKAWWRAAAAADAQIHSLASDVGF